MVDKDYVETLAVQALGMVALLETCTDGRVNSELVAAKEHLAYVAQRLGQERLHKRAATRPVDSFRWLPLGAARGGGC